MTVPVDGSLDQVSILLADESMDGTEKDAMWWPSDRLPSRPFATFVWRL